MRRHFAAVAVAIAATSLAVRAESQASPSRPLTPGESKYRSIFPAATRPAVLDPLKAEVGEWDADVELYVGDPARQPIRRRGVQTNRLVSDGHAVLNEFRYSDGSYAGTGMWGWDAFTNRYSGIWIDSETHLVRQDVGYWEPETRTLRWESDTLQPDGVTTRMRIVQRFLGDRRSFRIDLMDAKTGEFRKLIHMTFTRRPDVKPAG